MKYEFYKEIISKSTIFGVMPKEEKYTTLFRFGNSDWTPTKIQEIINGVEQSMDKEPDISFDWQNEDVFLRSNKYGVFFADLIERRAGQKSQKQNLTLEHKEFIKFLQDFKKFIEENS